MTIVGRSLIDHPALGTAGGSALHAAIETIYTNLGNDLSGRYFDESSVANSAVTTFTHNFGVQFADLKVLLYTGSHPNLTRVSDPVASGWTIAANGGNLKTQIDVTAPASGGPHTFALMVTHGRGAEKLKDLDDVDFAVAPVDGQLFTFDSGTTKWEPSYLRYTAEAAAIASNTITPTTGTTMQRITSGTGDIQMIAGPTAGKVYVLVNETGSDRTLKNDTGATAANRVYTGSGADLTLKNQASITLIYNSGLSRWIVAGGAGGFAFVNQDLDDAIALDRIAGAALFAPDILKALIDDGTILRPIEGRRNYCKQPSFFESAASSSALGWYAEDGTAANEAIGGTIPRESDGSAIVFTSNSTGSYLRYRFKADTADLLGRAILAAFSQIVAAAAEYKLEVYSGTSAALASAALITIQSSLTNSSGITGLPAGTMDIDHAFFHTNDRQYYEIRWTALGSAKQIKISGVYLGQQAIGSVPNVGKTETVTVTGSWSSNTTYTAKRTEIGQWAFYQIRVAVSGAPTSANLVVNLPSGDVIDTGNLANSSQQAGNLLPNSSVGIVDASVASYAGGVYYNDTVSVGILWTDDDAVATKFIAVTATAPMTWATGDSVTITFCVPLMRLAGAGLSTGPGSEPEYLSTSGTWDANSSTAVRGGSAIGGTLTASRAKTVTWSSPTQIDHLFEVLGSRDGINWVPMNGCNLAAGIVIPGIDSSGAVYSGVSYHHSSSTQTVVTFGQFLNFGNDDSPTTNWPGSNAFWMIRRYRNGQLPFARATATQSGLVSTDDQTFAGGKTFQNYIKLLSSGATAAELSFYATQTLTSQQWAPNGVGSTASPTGFSIRVTRIGNKVTVQIESGVFNATPAGTSTVLSTGNQLPAWALPPAQLIFPVFIVNNNAAVATPGICAITASGAIQLWRDPAQTAFTNALGAGLYNSLDVSYLVT